LLDLFWSVGALRNTKFQAPNSNSVVARIA
jgi:hypothetical protein